MNELVLPPSPNWYNSSLMVCTPDHHLVYAARKHIIIIKPAPTDEACEINVINDAHNDRVLSVTANLVTWGNPNKQIASVGDDRLVQLWDFEKLSLIMGHNAHENNNSPLVGVSFAGERVISVAENGYIVVWRLSTNTTQNIMSLFDRRTKVMCMATCPHASHITAFGLTTGLLVVADLRGNGKVLYRLREHDHDITSLSWCPVPYNIYRTESGVLFIDSLKQKLSKPATKNKELKDQLNTNVATSDIHLESKELNSEELEVSQLKTDIKSVDSEIKSVDTEINSDDIFAQKCQELQMELAQMKLESGKTSIDQEDGINHSSVKEPSKEIKSDLEESPVKEIQYPVRERPIVDKKNPWGNVVFNDSDEEDEINSIEPRSTLSGDEDKEFLTECADLMEKIKESKLADAAEESKTEDIFETSSDKETMPEKSPNDEHERDTSEEPFVECKESENGKNNSSSKVEDEKEGTDKDKLQAEIETIHLISPHISNLIVLEKVDSDNIDSQNLVLENVPNLIDTKTDSESKRDTLKSNSQEDLTSALECENAIITTSDKTKEAIDLENLKYKELHSTLSLNLAEPDSCKEFLLASACRNGTICLWRAGTDGRLEIQLPRHHKSSYNSKRKDHKQNWISICWAQPTLLLSSSIWNELLAWDLMPLANQKNKYQIKNSLVHADHKKLIFTIVVPFKMFKYPADEDWRSNTDLFSWTTSLDRWLLRTNLSTHCNLSYYSTCGGLIHCLSVSQLDPNRIAFAAGDGTIRFWDLSRPHTQKLNMTTFFDKVHTKASALDWHPTRENYLAFSTCEGRIGEYDLTNRAKAATIYSNYHRSTVHKIQWGPLPNSEEGKYGLYSCSLGELIVHDASMPNREPYQIPVFEEENISNFSWKSDYSILAVGSRTGTVKLLTPQFKTVHSLYMQKKSVRCLEWHPLATAYDNGYSEFSNYLAVGTMENIIFIYDCITQQHGDADISVNQKIITLEGHQNSVKHLCWCPHIGGRLVSSGEDGLLIVWDVKTQRLLSTYFCATDPAPCVSWSPLDADLIISGGKFLRIWRITKNPPVLPVTSKKTEHKHKTVQKIQKLEEKKVESEKRKAVLNKLTKLHNSHKNKLLTCRKIFEKLNNKVREINKTELSEDDSDSDHFEDAEEHTEVESELAADPVKLFGDRKDVMSLLNYEQSVHLAKKRIPHHAHIGLWKGNLAESLKHAIEHNCIDPWLINMAPMVSHKLWMQMCEKYAENLSEENQYLEASSYYLACHKVEEAIDILCKGCYFKEALAIAHCRLPEGNSTISSIFEKYAKNNVFTGCYEIAAQCYLYMGKLNEAAEQLNKRTDLKTLELAADIAEKAGSKDLFSSIRLKIDSIKNTQNNLETKTDGIHICESRLEALLLKNASDLKEKPSNDDLSNNKKDGSMEMNEIKEERTNNG